MQKTFKKISKVGLMLACALLAFKQEASAQMIIEVPAACEVVVAGVGGTIGFGGTVGSGGIVVMPDPFDKSGSAGDFVLDPDGNTITSWTLRGDLSVQTSNVPPAAPVQTVGASVTTVNIESYNKNLRPSEAAAPSTATLARSKGRVTIHYESEGCGSNSISFEIYKTYDNTSGTGSEYVPPIVGPSCWLPDSTYTYSVDHIASDNVMEAIGVDKYYWYIQDNQGDPRQNLTSYTSADNSSITLKTPSNLEVPYTISCCYGRANEWDGDNGPTASPNDHTTCVSLVVGGQPIDPDFITGVPSCLETGQTSFEVAITPVAGYTYTWSASNASWQLNTSGTQGQNLEVSSIGNEPGELKLKIAYGDCNPSEYTYPINRKFVAPLEISGESCMLAGSTNKYTLPDGALNNTTIWTVPQSPDVPSNWLQENANGAGSSINLTVPAGTPAGSYIISASSSVCTTGKLYFTVNVQPEKPSIIGGENCVIRNGGPTEFYTSSIPDGVTEFSWSRPNGWNCVSGCATDNPEMQPSGGAVAPVYMTVTAIGTNNCNAESDPFEINYKPVAPVSITHPSCWNFRVDGTTLLTVNNAPSSSFFGSYTVVASPNTLLNNYSVNPATGVISLNTSRNAGADSYTLYLTHTTNNCGSSSTEDFIVNFAGNGAMIGTNYDPMGSDTYFAMGVSGGPTYQWFKDENIIPGKTGALLELSGGTPNFDSVCVHITRGGCTTRKCVERGTHANAARMVFDADEEISEKAIFPNPNNGDFTVHVPKFDSYASLRILNSIGTEVSVRTLKAGKNRISNQTLPSGSYHVLLEIDGKTTIQQLQISK